MGSGRSYISGNNTQKNRTEKDLDSIHSRRHKLNKNAGKTGCCPSLYEKEKIDNAGKNQ